MKFNTRHVLSLAGVVIFFGIVIALALNGFPALDAQPDSYVEHTDGELKNTEGGEISFTYHAAEKTQHLRICEDVYQEGALLTSTVLLDREFGGSQAEGELSLSLSEAPTLDWTLHDGADELGWTTELRDTSYSGRSVVCLQEGKQALTGENGIVLAAVYQEGRYGEVNVYPAECENVLEELDKVVSGNDTVVLIRLTASPDAAAA